MAGSSTSSRNNLLRYTPATGGPTWNARSRTSCVRSGDLEQAEQQFAVGLAPITDTLEAQARYDIAVSNEINAEQLLSDTEEALRELTGELPVAPEILQEEIPLLKPDPANLDEWVSAANQQNPLVLAATAAAEVAKDGRVPDNVEALVVPGSKAVKAQAEAEGLDRIFKAAGGQWRFAGCSMCLAMNPDKLAPGERCASTSNRNFEGRVNPLVKANYLASPPLVVAYALAGTMELDLVTEPLGQDRDGNPIYLEEIWPSPDEIRETLTIHLVEELGEALDMDPASSNN